MDAPEIGETRRIEPVAPLGRSAQRLGRPPHVVLKQPGLRQSTSDLNLFVAVESWLAQRADEKRRGLGAHSTLQGPHGLSIEISRWHGREYSRYTGELDTELRTSRGRCPRERGSRVAGRGSREPANQEL